MVHTEDVSTSDHDAIRTAAQQLIAHCGNPVEAAMQLLTEAGYYSCRVKGTSPSGVCTTIEGGAPKPARVRMKAPKGGDLRREVKLDC